MARKFTKYPSNYIKSSYSMPVANECVPCWEFDSHAVDSFRELVDKIRNKLSRLDFVTNVGTSGYETVNPDTFALDIDVKMNKDLDELTDDEIEAIEDCGLLFGGKNFEI